MASREDDLDWLYREEDPTEKTAVLRPDQVDSIRRVDASGGRRLEDTASYPVPAQPLPGKGGGQPPTAPPAAPHGGSPEGPGGGKRKRKRPVLKTLGVVALAWLVFLVAVPVYAWSIGSKVDSFPAGERPAAQPGTTVLLVGSDGRADLTPEERKQLGTGSTEGQRTDTIMLLHVPTKGEPVLLSIPRDSLVEIPGRKDNKINAAFAFGGAPLLVETVEHNTGIHVDGYLEIGFLGIVDMVNAVGGIEVCPKFDFDDRDSHLKMTKGCQNVDGVTALGYVRMRKADKTGDLGRMERQREVIAAIGKKVASPMSVLNPVRYWQLNLAVSKSLARGDDTGIGTMATVGTGFLSIMSGKGISMMVPVSSANDRVSGVGSVMRWDKQASTEVFKAIAAGDTTSLEKYRK